MQAAGIQLHKKKVFMAMTCFMAAILILFSSVPARADGGLSLHTSYPGMSVKPGDSLSITVTLENASGAGVDADVALTESPEGWDGYLQGGSYQVNKVHVPGDGSGTTLTLHLTVPKDTAEGTYTAVIDASAPGMSASLPITFTISEKEEGKGSFTSEYPQQEGASGTSFSFSTTLINNGLTTQSYSLSSNAPAGWSVSFTPSGESTKIAGIDVESGESKGINVSVVPPTDIASGEYDISCSAVSAQETLSVDLKAVITGTYGLKLETPDGRLSFDAHAGSESDVTLNVTNTGNVDLTDVALTSSAPSGWTVTFDLEDNSIDSIAAGATTQVIAHVKPSSDAITGDYVTSFTARNSETSTSDTAEFRVSVKTSTIWGFVAIVIIVCVAGGLGYVFKKYGRR